MSILKIKNGSTWEEIPAGGVGVPSGGTAGQILMKSSSTDYADEWADISEAGAMSKWELLWTNASPDSSFSEQTLSIDLSGYDILMVEVSYYVPRSSYPDHSCGILPEKSVRFALTVFNGVNAAGYERGVTFADTGVTFSVATNTNSHANDNKGAVPIKVWGAKN